MITKRPATRLFLGLFCLLPSAAFADIFSIVIIPDTQMYVESNPEIFEAQVQWIIDHQLDTDKNIAYVAHLGDIKDDLSCDTKTVLFGGIPRTEWQIVRQVFNMLDTATSIGFPDGIPYGVLPGNHDFEPVSGQCPHFNIDIVPRPLVAYNLNFGPDSFNKLTGPPGIKRDYYGGNRVLGSNDDNYTLFSAAGIDFIAINLGYRGDANAVSDGGEMAWADARLKEFSSRIGIITSHDVLSCNDSGEPACDPFPNNFGNWAAQLYTVVANNKNLMMMTGAHKWGESWRVEDRSGAGHAPVQVLMSDYQRMVYPPGNPALPATFSNIGQTSFGNTGFMRMMTFDTITGIVTTTTFSPASVAALAGRPATVTDLVSSYFPYQALLSDGVITVAEMTTINTGTQMDPETASNIRFSFLGYTNDATPDPFSFTDQAGVALNTAITSNAITVSGIDAAADISVSGGQYSIDGGAFTSAAGTVNNGQSVRVRVTSSSSNSATTSATLTIGGVSDTFSVVTVAVPGTADSDSDFIEDHFDNCPFVPNGPAASFCASGAPDHQCAPEFQLALIDRRKQSYIDCLISQGVPAQDANMGIEAGICTFELFSGLLLDSYDDACGGSPCNGIQEDSDGDGIGNVCE